MSSPFQRQFSAKSPLLQREKKSQLERANALVKESQSDVDASRATFGTKDVDEAFDRKLRVLKDRVKKANSLGSNVGFDTTDASDAGEKRESPSPLEQSNANVGDFLDEMSFEEQASKKGYNIENISKVKKDDKGQYVVSLSEDEYDGESGPSQIVTNYNQGKNALRDTIRPTYSRKFTHPKTKK